MLVRDRTFNLLPFFYHQKHYICTFSENCSPTLNVFKVLLTYNLTVTEHKTQWTQTQSYSNRNHDNLQTSEWL